MRVIVTDLLYREPSVASAMKLEKEFIGYSNGLFEIPVTGPALILGSIYF